MRIAVFWEGMRSLGVFLNVSDRKFFINFARVLKKEFYPKEFVEDFFKSLLILSYHCAKS